jgi:hypothetical protein
MTSAAALRWLGDLKDYYRKAGEETLFWWDVHARHSSVHR